MGKRLALSDEEREFFGLVAQAAFTNPFGPERAAVDRRITGLGAGTDRERQTATVVQAVAARMQLLEAQGRADPDAYPEADGRLVRTAFLFHVFHRHVAAFDALIARQAAAGAEPCVVPFARAAMGSLVSRGFTQETAAQYFGLFYQLRRAYFFIYRSLVGPSESMSQLRLRLWQNLFTSDVRRYEAYLWNRMEDFSTLLLGETGVGKGAAAAAIGRSGFIPFDPGSGRFKESFAGTFISINLSQFSEALLESELFGHRKGAFTGAIDHHQGVLARCSPHGAIFLDEIGDVSLHAQLKLLKVLEEREFSPVGGHDPLRFEGRIIAATNRDVDALRREGKFRDDFYYRLCSDAIEVPPLRRRFQEDPRELTAMVGHLVGRLIGAEDAALTEQVCASLRLSPGPAYPWPGNVRELEQGVRRVLLHGVYSGEPLAEAGTLRQRLQQGWEDESLSAQDVVAGYCALLYQRHRNFVEVSRRTGLDRRTVKKYVEQMTRQDPD
jgi:DNA-binding NtrC family response regulator